MCSHLRSARKNLTRQCALRHLAVCSKCSCLTGILTADPDLLLADVVVPQTGGGQGRREPGRPEAEQQLAGEENISILRKYFSLSCCCQVRAQSQSMVRGEHPFMAFMLPSVSLSEAGSETDSLSVSSEQDQAWAGLPSQEGGRWTGGARLI